MWYLSIGLDLDLDGRDIDIPYTTSLNTLILFF